jgi:hypothetical protein
VGVGKPFRPQIFFLLWKRYISLFKMILFLLIPSLIVIFLSF